MWVSVVSKICRDERKVVTEQQLFLTLDDIEGQVWIGHRSSGNRSHVCLCGSTRSPERYLRPALRKQHWDTLVFT